MKRTNLFQNEIKKVFASLLLLAFVLTPATIFAQEFGATDDTVNSEQNYERINNGTAFEINSLGEPDYTSDRVSAEVNLGQTPIYPEQEPKGDVPAADTAADTAACLLGDFAKNVGKKAFGSVTEKIATATLNPTVVPVIDTSNQSKEIGTLGGVGPSWDQIGYCILNSIIQQISISTINWINSGFEGNPTFVDDPAGVLVSVGKNAVDSFLTGFGDGFLCNRFSLHIGLALTRKYREPEDLCTLEEVTQNMQRVLSGEDFSFRVWDELTLNPANNIFGAYLVADSKVGNEIAKKGNSLLTELSWGRGFLPWKNKETGKTITPGTTIGYAVESVTTLKSDRLVLADEFDEVLSALIQQLLRQGLQEWY